MTSCIYDRMYHPLTHPQLAIWHTEKFYVGTGFGNICSSTRIAGTVDFKLLSTAINLALKANDDLRLQIEEVGGHPFQYVSPYKEIEIAHFDFTGTNGDSAFSRWHDKQKCRHFKLTGSPLYYFATFCNDNGESGFYVQIHHLISDGWSVVWLSGRIMEYYTALRSGSDVIERPAGSYLDYVVSEQAYLESERFQKQKVYWTHKFETVPEFTTFKPHSTGAVTTSAGRKVYDISTELTQAINDLCSSARVSPFIVFLAVLYVYIYRVTEKSDMVVGSPVLNRSNAREKETFGMFISMVPLRMHIDRTVTVYKFIEQISKEWRSVLKNQKYPYDQIVRNFRDIHGTNDMLFDIVMSYQNAAAANDGQVDEHRILWHHNGHQTEALVIHINDRNNTGSYEIEFDYLTDVFTEAEIHTMWQHFSNILKGAAQDPHKKLSQLEMLSKDEKFRILYDFNKTAVDYPKDTTIDALFQRQAERTPFSIAIVEGELTLTYRELNEKANTVSRALQNRGIGSGSTAAILMEPSIEMIAGILGVLKAGAAYVPIDPEYPQERIRYILKDSGSAVLLSDPSYDLFSIEIDRVHVKELLENRGCKEPTDTVAKPSDAAYIIYTSGSTGKPKGVQVEHRSLVNLCTWHIRRFGITDVDRASKYAGVGFDASVWEMFPYLISGAALHIIEKAIRYDVLKLNDYFNRNGITVSFLPTQVCERFMELENHSLRYLLTGADKLNKYIGSSYQIVNNYGPTESTVVTTSFDVDRSYINIPIGKPIDNTRLYILSRSRAVQPVGVPGELYIAGDGLARGYVGSEELTKEKFVDGTLVGEVRLYRTGDLARWLPDGNVEFLGRIDNQVKIRGHRIETGEIEVCLLSCLKVRQAVVVVKDEGNGQRYLCAYYVAAQELDSGRLRTELLSKLPDYMVPLQYIYMDRIPLTPNGKIDRSKLPNIKLSSVTDAVAIEPKTETEKMIVQTAGEILNNRVIGTNHNLLNVGFDSLMLIQLIAELGSAGLDISMQDFYECLTVRDIALCIEGHKHKECAIPEVCPPQNRAAESAMTLICEEGDEELRSVLLTGATGYLGIHLLNELLQSTDADITCLIRGTDNIQAESRILKAVHEYFPEIPPEQVRRRVTAICGDISKPLLGLDETGYHALGSHVDTVFNPAANVKHYGSYEQFESTNINGVKNLICFCERYNLRLNQISTVSVSGNYALQRCAGLLFSETDLTIGQDISDNPYVRSKHEAEKQIEQAVLRGMRCSVFRVGNLTGRYSDGVFQTNIGDNRFYNILRTIMVTGTIPESMLNQETDLTPVDQCSRAIVLLASKKHTSSQRAHLFNSPVISIQKLADFLSEKNIKIRTLNDVEFMDNLNRTTRETGDFELLKGFIGLSKSQNHKERLHPVTVNADMTLKWLESQGFVWPEIDSMYIERIVDHICETGFIRTK